MSEVVMVEPQTPLLTVSDFDLVRSRQPSSRHQAHQQTQEQSQCSHPPQRSPSLS